MIVVVFVAMAIGVGIIGTVVPVFPGLVLCFVAVVGYGFAAGFDALALGALTVCSGLFAAGTYAGIRIPQRSARESGLSTLGQWFAFALGVIGLFTVPVVGLPIGFALGVLADRWIDTRDLDGALVATRRALVAMAKASGVQLLCGVAMAAVWTVWVLAGGVPKL